MYTEYYSEVKKIKKHGIRGIVRENLLDLISKPVFLDFSALKKPRIQFLYVHHVFKDEEAGLVELIEFLGKEHSFISYSEAVDRLLQGNIDKPYIVFSSDDGLKNNLVAASILKRYEISACFFVNPFTIEHHSFDTVKKFCEEKLHFPPVEFMNWSDLGTLLEMGHEIGSHTMTHINVAATEPKLVREELEKSREILEQQIGAIKHFAYPYGRYFHFNEQARKDVFEIGYGSCASAERGCHVSNGDKIKPEELLIRRDHVILDWNPDHYKYFLIRNSKKAQTSNNLFPNL
jgi:peptidoglycan/xylan/chitin deacetylase (PgdA/CDA1 family)